MEYNKEILEYLGCRIDYATILDAKIWIKRGILHFKSEILYNTEKIRTINIDDCFHCVTKIMKTLRANKASELINKRIRIATSPNEKTIFIGHEVLDIWCWIN